MKEYNWNLIDGKRYSGGERNGLERKLVCIFIPGNQQGCPACPWGHVSHNCYGEGEDGGDSKVYGESQ